MNTSNRADQGIFKKKITIRQMADAVRLGKTIGKTVFFFGGAGLGKSQKMKQIADWLYPNNKNNNLCDVRLSDKEPQDIAGIQIPIEMEDGTTKTVYATPDFWPKDPEWEGIVFLDELPNAPLSTQHSSYQVILDHIAGTFKFPKGSVFVGAGNRDTDNAGTTEMPGPLVNRMIVYEVKYDLDIWIEDYAIPNKIYPAVIGFLKKFVQYFYTGDVTDRPNMVFSSPRQWKTVSDILYQHSKGELSDYMTEVSIAGAVGEGLDSLVMDYHVRAEKLPALEGIFDGTAPPHHLGPEDIDLVYVLSQSCMMEIEGFVMSSELTDSQVIEKISNFLTFMNKNHGRTSKDIIMAVMVSLFRAPTGGEAVLKKNPKRGKLMPMLRRDAPEVMKIVMEYQERYGDIMEEFNR